MYIIFYFSKLITLYITITTLCLLGCTIIYIYQYFLYHFHFYDITTFTSIYLLHTKKTIHAN